MSKLQRNAQVAEIVSVLIVAVSVLIAILAYFNETDKQRREFTMEIASQFFSGELQEHKESLFHTILSIQKEVSPAQLGASDIAVYIEKSGRFSDMSDNRLNSALLSLTSFFNSAHRCVEAKLCDEDLLRRLVTEDATSINCAFSTYLDALVNASNANGLIRGIKFFDEQQCG